MNRIFLVKLHLIGAALMFPVLLMFVITGALYTWGSEGKWHENKSTITLTKPYAEHSEGELISIAVQELLKQETPVPSGTPKLNEAGKKQVLNWGGARSAMSIKHAKDPMTANVSIRNASLQRWMVQLHKAKGSDAFKVYATIMAVCLLLLVVSGMIMGLQVKSLRKITLISSVAGLAAFAGLAITG